MELIREISGAGGTGEPGRAGTCSEEAAATRLQHTGARQEFGPSAGR